MSVRITAYGHSVVGKVRARNEDTLAVIPSEGVVVVADGMGGAPGGDVASAMAVQEVIRGLHGREEMGEAVRRANGKIREMVRSRRELEGMGTTVTALRLFGEEGRYEVGHVGDSRAYRFSAGALVPITRDHTMVRELVEQGRLAPEAERSHPMSHILTRAVGTSEEVEVEVTRGDALPGDVFLVCSDGLVKVLDDGEVAAWVGRWGELGLEGVVEGMIQEGELRGAPDNITVALAALEEAGTLP